jgi:hypothetical protein
MTAAAITGPTPKMPVRLVPAARTAASVLLRVWRIRASVPGRPAACSAASCQRAAATASAGVMDARIGPAWPAVTCLRTPPGISSHSTAWSRQATWVRARPRSLYRLGQTLSTTQRSSRQASRTPAERSAATAAERASFGSFLFVLPAASSRTRAASSGWISSTHSPAASSCQASSCPCPPAPSTAQVRCGHAAAQASSCRTWSALARTRSSPSCSSAALTAAPYANPYADPHQSLPPPWRCPPLSLDLGVVTVAGMPTSRTAAEVRASEPRHGQAPAGLARR